MRLPTAYGHNFVPQREHPRHCSDCGRADGEHLIKSEVHLLNTCQYHDSVMQCPFQEEYPGTRYCVFHRLKIEDEEKQKENEKMAYTEKDIAKFSSGAVRSEKAPPWFMMPWEAVRVVLERFNIGAFKKGYGVHNWKKAIGTGDLAFIQQLFDHTFTHMMMFIANVGEWRVETEGKHANETPMDHLAAMGWGVLALITYTMYDRVNVQKAFSKWPGLGSIDGSGHPPSSEFELRDNQWVALGRPEPPSFEAIKAQVDKDLAERVREAKGIVYEQEKGQK